MEKNYDENNFNDIKKILVDYLNNSEDDENKLFLEDFIDDEDDL